MRLKTPWRDGTTHLKLSPLEFLQRLAALVPRPRLHLIRFHGVLAPNTRLRQEVVPSDAVRSDGASPDATVGPVLAPSRLNWARLLQRVFALDVEHCPNCGGSLKLIAAILDTVVIVKILTHLGLPARAPRAPARPLPGLDFT